MNHIILLDSSGNGGQTINFEQIFAIDKKYVGQALAMSQVFQGAVESVKIDGRNSLKFNFDKALDLVKAHQEMALVGIVNQTVTQSSAQVSAMVDKVLGLVKNTLSITLSETQKEAYETSITDAFTNLAKQKDSAWIFWQSQKAHKTTYQYNIFFAIQNDETGSVMLALPMSLTINVDIEKEKVLGITIKDKANYSVNVQAIQVVEALQE